MYMASDMLYVKLSRMSNWIRFELLELQEIIIPAFLLSTHPIVGPNIHPFTYPSI
jgi:hypothetical protein